MDMEGYMWTDIWIETTEWIKIVGHFWDMKKDLEYRLNYFQTYRSNTECQMKEPWSLEAELEAIAYRNALTNGTRPRSTIIRMIQIEKEVVWKLIYF